MIPSVRKHVPDESPFPEGTDGLKLLTVVDGTMNPWDMDPGKTGRQTKGTWEFGVDSHPLPEGATRREPTEEYQ